MRSSRPLAACVAVSLAAHASVFATTFGGHVAAEPATHPPPREAAQAGETFQVPEEEVSVDLAAGHGAAPATLAEAPPAAEGTHGGEPTVPNGAEPTRRSPPRSHSPSATATPGTDDGDPSARFGAVGDRSAVELATAFTRGFPQAASADPAWLEAPFGSAGTVDLTVTIGEDGALLDARTTGSPSPALAHGIKRTIALIRARAFVAESRETRLRLTATVTKDQVHDGLHGEVFAIGGSFERGEGSGFFALAVGRRVDVRVQVLK